MVSTLFKAHAVDALRTVLLAAVILTLVQLAPTAPTSTTVIALCLVLQKLIPTLPQIIAYRALTHSVLNALQVPILANNARLHLQWILLEAAGIVLLGIYIIV